MAEITLTNANFESEAVKSDKPILIDFWATWCGPCKMLAPVIEEIAREYDGIIKIGKVNVDDEPSLAAAFGIASIPTLIVMENGEIKNTSVGYRPKEDIVKMLGL